jgi:peptide/nickel transport system substrate-binding protein
MGDEINAGTYDLFHWGWIPDPDPASALSWFTCGERPPDGTSYGNNDSYYCNPEYDKLYAAQRTAMEVQERWDIVHQMQKMYYESGAYSVLWYDPLLQAYRTDRFTGYMSQPAPKGDLLAGYSMDVWWNLRSVSGAGSATEATGISAGVWIGLVVGVIVVVAAILLGRRTRRAGEEQT